MYIAQKKLKIKILAGTEMVIILTILKIQLLRSHSLIIA